MSESINDETTVAGAESTAAARSADGSTASQADVVSADAEIVQDGVNTAETVNTPPATETSNQDDSVKNDGASTTEPVAPTPEEQAEIDSMVDYTITEATLAEFPTTYPDGRTVAVGDVVKLPANHPLVTAQA